MPFPSDSPPKLTSLQIFTHQKLYILEAFARRNIQKCQYTGKRKRFYLDYLTTL